MVPQLTTPRPEDLSQECTGMLAALCMAQVRGYKARMYVVGRWCASSHRSAQDLNAP